MSWKKNKSLRVFALSVFAAPATLFAGEPRIIVPSPKPPQVVFETDNSTYDVLNRFRNARSSEQIHFQAIETLFPPTPERASIRRGYTMVKELVDAKKAATEAATRLEAERVRLESVRAELERQAAEQRAAEERAAEEREAAEKREAEPHEFDYYDFDNSKVEPRSEPEPVGALEPEPEPGLSPKPAARTTQRSHQHHHRHHHHHHVRHGSRRNAHVAPHTPVRRGGLLGYLFQK